MKGPYFDPALDVDGQTTVPMLVRVPGNESNGRRTSGLVELVDVYPTLVDLCDCLKAGRK